MPPPYWYASVTPRRAEILDALLELHNINAVAERLGITPSAVGSQLAEVRNRMSAKDNWELCRTWEKERGPWAAAVLQRAGIPLAEVVAAMERAAGSGDSG